MRTLLSLVCALVALAFSAVGAFTLITGEAPRAATAAHRADDLASGITAVAIGLLAALAARALWRARHERTRGSGVFAPLALGAALLATLAARLGDDLARHADDLVSPSAAARQPYFSEAAFFEEPLETVGLLLDIQEAREAFLTLHERLAADVIVSSRLALTGTIERYTLLDEGRYLLTQQRTERHHSIARNGVLESQDVTVDDSPPDAVRGESVHLTFAPRPTATDGEREVRSIVFELTEPGHSGGPPVSSAVPNEVELVDTTYDAVTGEVAVKLRTTAEGQQQAAAALSEVMRHRLTSVLTPEALGVQRVELDVSVPSVAGATLTLTTSGIELVTDGTTIIDVTARGWR